MLVLSSFGLGLWSYLGRAYWGAQLQQLQGLGGGGVLFGIGVCARVYLFRAKNSDFLKSVLDIGVAALRF